MKIKSGVNLEGVSWRMFLAAVKCESVLNAFGAEFVITSANDSKHMDGSKHYSGEAIDVRTWQIRGREGSVARELRNTLGPDYDVVIESDHLHIEYDPKTV